MEPAWDALPRGALVGRYLVLERIGQGGMGVVYSAFDPQLDRRIALKLLRPGRGPLGPRLVREARLMAQVSHPDVIAVYDVGTLGDRLFIAMEHVEGQTLKSWLKGRPRTAREVVAVFLRAGAGLAAAHAAGVVHRDFKPDNVLVGKDGRVRVTDFGVARLAWEDDQPAAPATPPPPSAHLFSDTNNAAVIVGSPAYLAPEILDGKEADARSDLFSFCVALYEGLYGERPFAGGDVFKLRAQIKLGAVREPPKGSAVPAYLRRAVLSGLRASPSSRCASMNELLAALSRAPQRRRLRGLGLAAGALAFVSAVVLIERRRGAVCRGADARLATVWNDGRRAAVKRALPESAWEGTARLFDDYAQRWVSMRTEACEATQVRGEQSALLLDLKMECFERKLADLSALSELLAAGVGKAKATDAAAALPALDDCANGLALRAHASLPDDPAARKRIGALRVQLAKANALVSAGDDAHALELAQQIRAGTSAAGYASLTAEAEWIVARAMTQSGDLHAAEAATHQVAIDAERAGDDELAATAWISLAWDVGHRQGRAEEGRLWASYAGAALERAGGVDSLEALRLRALGFIDYDQGKLDDALAGFRRAQALLERRKLSNSTLYALVLEGVGISLEGQGKAEAALAVHERSLALRKALLGPDHPHVAFAEDQLSSDLLALGRPKEALLHVQRGLAIREKALPADSPFIAFSLSRIGFALHALQRDEEALDSHRRALALAERRLGPQGRDLAFMLQGIGEDLRGLRKPLEAIAPLERALALRERYAVDAALLGDTRFELAQAILEANPLERERARALGLLAAADYERAIARGEREAQTRDQRVGAWLALH